MRRRFAIALGLTLVFISCATNQRPRPAEDSGGAPAEAQPPAAAPGPNSSNPTEGVPLEVRLTDQTSTGRVMKLRAKIVNNQAEVVSGVRVQLVLLVPSEDGGGKILEIQQKELGGTIAPGDSTMLSWNVESMYVGSNFQFIVAAYPKRLGDRDLPPPDNWTE